MAFLDLLFSTYEDRIYDLISTLPKYKEGQKIIIVHQTMRSEGFDRVNKFFQQRSDVTYVKQFSYGVTKSRNLAITLATSDYILFCDDDVVYTDNLYDIVVGALQNSVACTFRVASTEGGFTKEFSEFSKRHTRLSILSVGTIEIACQREFLIEHSIKFPEDLGAGARYPCCDEPVFLSRIIDKGASVTYVPITICAHPAISSGMSLNSGVGIMSRLIAFKYIFGRFFYIPLFILFCLKNINKIGFKALLSLIKILIERRL